MKVKELIEELSKLDPEMSVLGEFDQDGDSFMVKYDVSGLYVGNSCDDSGWIYNEEDTDNYCILQVGFI